VYGQLAGIGKYIDILMKVLRKHYDVHLYTPADFPSIPFAYGYRICIPRGTLKEDVVHAQTPYMLGHWALTRGKPTVITTHTFQEHLSVLGYLPFAKRLLAHYYNSGDRLICQTQEVYEHLSKIGMRKPDYIIPNPFDFDFCKGVGEDLFREKFGLEGQFVFASFRLSREKNAIDFIRLAALMPDVKFVLGGIGPELDWLRSTATRNVLFTGLLCPEMLKSAYKACDILVHPALVEMFGYSVVEAMAFGKPVIVRNIPDFNFLGDSVLRYKSLEDLRDKVRELLHDGRVMAKVKRKAAEKVKEFDVWKIAPRVGKVYEDALESHR
jgi:glycosyltransferase involved in cell wall biosynthesis